jgi:hypothetical protein
MLDWLSRKLGEWEERQRQLAREHQRRAAMDPALFSGSVYGGGWFDGGGGGGCDSGGGDCGGGDG